MGRMCRSWGGRGGESGSEGGGGGGGGGREEGGMDVEGRGEI